MIEPSNRINIISFFDELLDEGQYCNAIFDAINDSKKEIKNESRIILSKRAIASIMTCKPYYRVDAFERFFGVTNDLLNSVDYQKQSLKELRRYLLTVRRTLGFDSLTDFDNIISIFNELQTIRRDSFYQEDIMFNTGVNGVNYFPTDYDPSLWLKYDEEAKKHMGLIRSKFQK